MISIETALRHTAWADDELFGKLAELPDNALLCHYGNPDWIVARIAIHIVSGAQWYRFLLSREPWTDLAPPEGASIDQLRQHLAGLRQHLADLHSFLIAEASKDDEAVNYTEDDGHVVRTSRAMLLTQAAYHSTEHRAQIACALEVNGIPGYSLDDYDAWAWFNATEPHPA